MLSCSYTCECSINRYDAEPIIISHVTRNTWQYFLNAFFAILHRSTSLIYVHLVHIFSEWLNLYSDWLRAGWWGSIPGRRTDFTSLLSIFGKKKGGLMVSLCGLSVCVFPSNFRLEAYETTFLSVSLQSVSYQRKGISSSQNLFLLSHPYRFFGST
jgi:hypothetical protein